MKSSVKRNLLIGFGVSMLLLIVSSVASYNSIKGLINSIDQVNHTDSVIQTLESVLSTLKDAETGQRGFLLTGEEKFLEPYNGAYELATSKLNVVERLVVNNDRQEAAITKLKENIQQRLSSLSHLIEKKRSGQAVDVSELDAGKNYMDEARILVKQVETREEEVLNTRTASMNNYATYTPILILIAACISVIITLISFTRVNSDINKRAELQKELEEKDADITRRIDIIQDVADKISDGNYTTRVQGQGSDGLGSVAESLNKMAESLDYSFGILSDREWMQTGIATINEHIIGEQEMRSLTQSIITIVAEYTNSQVGALYLLNDNDELQLQSGFAFERTQQREIIKVGEGVIGQSVASRKEIILKDIAAEDISVSYAVGQLKPKTIVAIPLFHENIVNGVIELGTIYDYSPKTIDFLKAVTTTVGTAINSALSRMRMQQLLEETQAQGEELQTQQSHLESMNAELETQAMSLQASEEELKVQQEELQQANSELQERSRLLEEKNQVIVERNLDIQKKADELALSTKYKSEFLANMSHELRTPLNSILLLSRLLSENNEENLNSEQIESAKVIQSSGNGLLSLIDEILDLSKIEAGKMDIEPAYVAVSEITDDMRSLFFAMAREKNLDLQINVSSSLPATIETDKMRLEQILKNLLSNALKFTTRGSVKLNVEEVKNDARLIRFSVIDTGIGIPADKQGLVFEAFQQADGSTKRKYGGTGLGLSISRELSRLLGGDINVASMPGEGSTFSLTIPRIQAMRNETVADEPIHDAYVNDDTDERTSMLHTQQKKRFTVPEIPLDVIDDRHNISGNDKTILIVEDDTNFATALMNFTKRRGYKAVVSVRGDQALDMALQYKPVAILLDIQLPVLDGWEVMNALKADVRTRHIPVHTMSSLDAKRESLMSGAVDFINKPVALEQMQEIFQKLEDALNKGPRKVLIVEENPRHAKALAYFLETFDVNSRIKDNVKDSINELSVKGVDCVILDMGLPSNNAYDTLEAIKKTPGYENLPIIVFTGKSLSRAEEARIKKYADSIIVKTAHSYQRILDEVALFLHLIEEHHDGKKPQRHDKVGGLDEVLKGKTVLVADDDVRNIFSLTKSLEQHGMKVLSATDGKEALQVLSDNPALDVVLMDMMMPEMDGYESTKRIRQIPRYKSLPVLAVTAKAMLGDREKCMQAGASDYISKPVDIDQLLSLLRVWLYDKLS